MASQWHHIHIHINSRIHIRTNINISLVASALSLNTRDLLAASSSLSFQVFIKLELDLVQNLKESEAAREKLREVASQPNSQRAREPESNL